MDIYSFRLISIILILGLSTIWLFMYLRNKNNKGTQGNVRGRGMDQHSMGPLFLDEEGQEKLRQDEDAEEVPKPPQQQDDSAGESEKVAEKKSVGLNILKNLTKKSKPAPKQEPSDKSAQKKKTEDTQIICLQLNSRKQEGFNGHSLLAMFSKYELVFGKMDVFHRQTNMGGQDRVLFSVINGEAPGTLVPEEIKDRSTQRIMFYIALNECHSPMKAFEEMLDIAQKFAVSLDGMLCDDQGCDLSEQNIEFHWDLVREFMIRNRIRPAVNK